MTNEKINEVKSLDKFFPKGNKKRGEALVLSAESFLKGKEQGKQETLNFVSEVLDKLKETTDAGDLGYNPVEIVKLKELKSSLGIE